MLINIYYLSIFQHLIIYNQIVTKVKTNCDNNLIRMIQIIGNIYSSTKVILNVEKKNSIIYKVLMLFNIFILHTIHYAHQACCLINTSIPCWVTWLLIFLLNFTSNILVLHFFNTKMWLRNLLKKFVRFFIIILPHVVSSSVWLFK